MIAFEKKIPSNTNFCYGSECHICEETSRGIIIIVAIIIIIMIIIIIIVIIIITIIIIIIVIIIIHYHHHCYYCCYYYHYYYHYYYYYYCYYYYYYHSINNIPYQCDINCAGHFTLDALASRPVACIFMWENLSDHPNHYSMFYIRRRPDAVFAADSPSHHRSSASTSTYRGSPISINTSSECLGTNLWQPRWVGSKSSKS